MTLADAIANYVGLEQSMGMRFHSERGILNALHRHVGDVDLTEVSTEAVAAFLAGRGPITATWLGQSRLHEAAGAGEVASPQGSSRRRRILIWRFGC
jgi:integrase/recombinase XerD